MYIFISSEKRMPMQFQFHAGVIEISSASIFRFTGMQFAGFTKCFASGCLSVKYGNVSEKAPED